MSFNPFYDFKEAGASPAPEDEMAYRSDDPEYKQGYVPALRALRKHMYEISDDPSGSEPKDYLSEDDAKICGRVTRLANHLGWPTANDFGRLEVSKKPGRYPAWGGGFLDKYDKCLRPLGWRSGPLNIAKAGLTKALFFREKGEEHQGYILGKLGAYPDQLVALCEDGKLRSLRAQELRKSKAIGWGRLPDQDKLEPALGTGKATGVVYMDVVTNPKSKTLAGKLLENVPSELLDSDTLARCGLLGYL